MLRWWTELLPVFVFRRIARRCGCVPWGGCDWHEARPGILVRDEQSWREYRVGIVEESVRHRGIETAEAQWGHFGKDILSEGIRKAFIDAGQEQTHA